MKTLIKYDLIYLLKTKKFIIFPAIFGIFALLSPILAMYLPELLNSLGSIDGIVIQMPEPTVMDAYRQYFSDMNETILFIIIFFSISMFIRDKTKGLYPMIFSKPIDRRKYILSKFITSIILIFVSLLVGIIGFSAYTFILFEEIAIIPFLYSNLLLFMYFAFITSICLIFATVNKSYFTALLSSFAVYLITVFLSVIRISPFKYLPVRLSSLSIEIMADVADSGTIAYSLSLTILLIAILVISTIRTFSKQEVN